MKEVVYALIVGVVITLITGFVSNTPSGLLGAVHYGFPLVWRIVPVVPEPEASYDLVKFVVDVVFWFVIAAVIIFLVKKIKS